MNERDTPERDTPERNTPERNTPERNTPERNTPERNIPGRRVVSIDEALFTPYVRYGEAVPGLSWLNVSYDDETGHGTFLIRFAPGSRSLPHEHTGIEEFLVLEGSLVDDDGEVFGAGDFVSFAPGSRHSSAAPDGCLIVVFLRGRNRLVGKD